MLKCDFGVFTLSHAPESDVYTYRLNHSIIRQGERLALTAYEARECGPVTDETFWKLNTLEILALLRLSVMQGED